MSGAATKTKKNKTNCCVYGCHILKSKEPSVSFHFFPPENSSKVKVVGFDGNVELMDRRKAWQRALLMENRPTRFLRVCGKHFTAKDYVSRPSLVKKPRLKQTAVPSLNLPKIKFDNSSHKNDLDKKKKQRARKRNFKKSRLETQDDKEVADLDFVFSMPKKCCVFGCSSSSGQQAESDVNPKHSFHVFPDKEKFSSLHKVWIKQINRKNFIPFKHSYVCSDHFTEDCFEPSSLLKEKLMPNQKTRRLLKKDAFPTLFLNGKEDKGRCATYKRRKIIKEAVDELPINTEETLVESPYCQEQNSTNLFNNNCMQSELGNETYSNKDEKIENISDDHESNTSTFFRDYEEEESEEKINVMPGNYCGVPSCRNYYGKTVKNKTLAVSYHKFPRDPNLRNLWIEACGKEGEIITGITCVCSKHFAPEDFENRLRNTLITDANIKSSKRKLKPGAVPTLHLKKENNIKLKVKEELLEIYEEPLRDIKIESCSYEQSEELLAENFNNSEKKDELLFEVKTESCSYEQSEEWLAENFNNLEKEDELLLEVKTESCSYEESEESLVEEYNKLEKENKRLSNVKTESCSYEEPEESLTEKCNKLEIENDLLREKIKLLEEKNKKLMEKVEKQEKEIFVFSKEKEISEKTLSKVFSKTQLNILAKKKEVVVWGYDDIIYKALALRYLSKPSYDYVKNTLGIPLPLIGTLQKWSKNIKFSGLVKDVLTIMKIASLSMTDLDKHCVIQFDEIKTNSVYEYDKLNDQLSSPHSYLQVIMVRGLFKNWKQPIFIGFDQKITKELLFRVISALHEISYRPVACVSGCKNSKEDVWKLLDVSVDKPFFEDPVSGEKIYMFVDALHLLKQLRNYFLDTGFILRDGKKITKQPIINLINSTNEEISSRHKLTEKHIDCMRPQRQNFSLVIQLLSHTTATALCDSKIDDEAEVTGNFIELVSKWFDIMHSYPPEMNFCMKQPFGIDLKNQISVLNEMYDTIYAMTCRQKDCLQTFQKGILMSINSLKCLFEDLKQHLIPYIVTSRLNLDSLENLFSKITDGLLDHPSPVEAINKLRSIVLGGNPDVAPKNVNDDEYLTADVFSKVGIQVPGPPVMEDSVLFLPSSVSTSASTIQFPYELSSEKEGFKYLCEWIARRYKTKYSWMDDYTKNLEEHSYVEKKHLFLVETQPSQKWLAIADILESCFQELDASNLFKYKNIVKTLIVKFKKRLPYDLPYDILHIFALQRIYIRINWLNSMKKSLKRKLTEVTNNM